MVCTTFDIVDDDIALEGDEAFNVEFEFVNPQFDVVKGTTEPGMVIIEDNDVVTVRFTEPMYTVDEDGGPAVVCVEKDKEIAERFTVRLPTQEGTASDPPDYDGTAQSVEFTPGGPNMLCANFPITDDDLTEGTETFTVSLEPLNPNVEVGDPSTTTVNIIDDEIVTVTIVPPMVRVPEDDGNVTICLEANSGIADDLEVNITVSEKPTPDATAPEDFIEATKTVFFVQSGGGQRVCTTFEIVDDDIALEGDEAFNVVFEFVNPQFPVDKGSNDPGMVIIVDDDVVEVEFEFPMYVVDESDRDREVCLVTDIPVAEEFVVTVRAEESSPRSARRLLDFLESEQDVTFGPGVMRQCVDFEILDDNIANEINETFMGVFDLPAIPGVRDGGIPETTIVILDNDEVTVDFDTEDVTVFEREGVAEVCLKIDEPIGDPLVIELTTAEKADTTDKADPGTDFRDTALFITFQPGDERACANITIIDDDVVETSDEQFVVEFKISGPGVKAGMQTNATVHILDDDRAVSRVDCSITSPLMITPFSISQQYHFSGTCEHTLFSFCNDSLPDLEIVGDFLSSDLSNGRIGVKLGDSVFVYMEDGSVEVRNAAEISVSGNTTVYEGGVSVTIGSNQVVFAINVFARQVFVTASPDSFNIQFPGVGLETCGLCGSLDGTLLYSDGTVADIMSIEEVNDFASTYVVQAADQVLREEQRRICGCIGNDTVIGDPLLSVPIYKDQTSLCFEVHGAANRTFNLVSDVCTSVNALYTPMVNPDNGNIISEIGVLAVGDGATCHEIQVLLDGCRVFADGTEVTTQSLTANGIRVRRINGNKIRISVPNCDNVKLIMSVTCQRVRDQDMLRFDISRGLNLRPSSHGLLGQFWNIQVDTEQYIGPLPPDLEPWRDQYHVFTVIPEDGSAPRRFLAELYNRRWDKSQYPCYYAGNGQGGRSGEAAAVDDSVIQGRYSDYITTGIFEPEFQYSTFDTTLCP